MRIIITMDLDDDYADPHHEMGVTEEGYEEIIDAIGHLGTDIAIRKNEVHVVIAPFEIATEANPQA